MSLHSSARSRLARGISVGLLSAAAAVALAPASPAAAATEAIIPDSGCTTNSLAPNDDGSTGAIALPSTLKFYDRDVTQAFVNNNGNITFDGPMGNYSGHISTLPNPVVAPFFTDLETTYTGTPVTYGTATYGGHDALCVNWLNVGFYSTGTAPTNDFQALLVDRSDLSAGDFDVIFNYGRVDGDYGWNGAELAAQIGFNAADGNSEHHYVFPGSSTPNAFLDSNSETGLVHGSRDSAVLGRYTFHFRNGELTDVPAPNTTLTAQPGSPDNAAPTFTYTSTSSPQEHGRFDCRITAQGETPGAWGTCPDDGITYEELGDGTWTFEVRAADVYLNADDTPASATFTLDRSGPETQLDSTSAALSNDNTPSFTWSSDATDLASFECNLNRPEGGEPSPWYACDDEGETLTNLDDGPWTFQVRGVDDLGNTDPTPASYDFVIDTAATSVSIETAPAMLGNDATPTFTYLADPDTDVDHFECVVVPEGAQSATPEECLDEGFTSEELEDGNYRFGVSTVDLAGNIGDPALYDFTVDTLAADTVVSSGPQAVGNNNAPALTYAAAPAADVDHFECRLVGGAPTVFAPCETAGTAYAGLADGDYTFEVRSVDAAGNIDASQATYAFQVDTAAPDTSVTNAPAATIGTDSATFGYDSDSDGATFECRLAAAGAEAAWGACPEAGKTFAGLADGGYLFDVRATDAAGNTDATPATHKFAVNVGRPTITAAIVSELPISAAGWYRNVVTVTYTCAGNGSALTTPCPAPRQVPRAQQGRVLFTASITTADGDTATVRTPLFIDKGKPSAIIKGFDTSRVYTSVPRARCKAADPRSGLDTCTVKVRKVHTRDGSFIKVKATATDLAGNVRVVTRKARFERG